MIAIDTETYLIRGRNVPPLVCVSFAEMTGENWKTGVLRGQDAYEYVRTALEHEKIVMHNARFDLCVLGRAFPSLLPLIYDALAENRISDTKIREKLHKIASGGSGAGIIQTENNNRLTKLSLAGLAYKYLGIDLSSDKSAGSVRYRYDELASQELNEWPSEAIEYASQDAIITGLVYYCQSAEIDSDELYDEHAQIRADYVLGVMGAEGVMVDRSSVETVRDALKLECDEIATRVKRAGYMDARGKLITSRIKERIDYCLTEAGKEVPKTDSGEISTNRDALLATEDPDLADINQFKQAQKLLSTYVGDLESATAYGDVLRAEYSVLMVTGRTSCKNPNLQNLPRRGGIRDCFIPKENHVFILCDYDAVEMRTLAQCFIDLTGEQSPLAEMYASDPQFDPHAYFGAQLLNIDYETMLERLKTGDPQAKSMRQRAKPANFGYAGGMGAGAFMGYARGYGVELTENEARDLRTRWIATYNMQPWFDEAQRANEAGFVVCPSSQRKRGRASYTECCNMPFQGMASDGAKRALFAVSRECYADTESVLFGCRPLVFVHDEIILEAPAENAHHCAMRLKQIMETEMRHVTPDIPASATPALASRWLKNAEPKYNDAGELILWG